MLNPNYFDDVKMKVVTVNHSLLNDVYSVIGSMYSMNAPNAIGYLFNPNGNYKKIANGMYCDSKREIDIDSWTYFYNYQNKQIYKLL